MKRNKKAFTLIELIAVLVILAILALIVTPLVLNIIKKARTAADKRSIDAYGRSIELAIADYLLDTGKFPTSIDELTIEYSGNKVECKTTQLNEDSSVYLAECKVNSRDVIGYTYGKGEKEDPTASYEAYSLGDIIQYNGIQYYVIKDSSTSESSVTLLKAEPLTVEQINTYGGVGTEHNVVNKYARDDNDLQPIGTAYDHIGYGGMAYYESETCYYKGMGSYESSNCITDYAQSKVKYVIDAWKTDEVPEASEARLITREEIENNFEFEEYEMQCGGCGAKGQRISEKWMYNSNYSYWTMSQYNDLGSNVWFVGADGGLTGNGVYRNHYVVRPVIVLSKSAL